MVEFGGNEFGSVIKSSSELLRQGDREEGHAWRLVQARMRTNLGDFDEFSGPRFEDITGGEALPAQNSTLSHKVQWYTQATGKSTLVDGPPREPSAEGTTSAFKSRSAWVDPGCASRTRQSLRGSEICVRRPSSSPAPDARRNHVSSWHSWPPDFSDTEDNLDMICGLRGCRERNTDR